jgi:hypothetical protein
MPFAARPSRLLIDIAPSAFVSSPRNSSMPNLDQRINWSKWRTNCQTCMLAPAAAMCVDKTTSLMPGSSARLAIQVCLTARIESIPPSVPEFTPAPGPLIMRCAACRGTKFASNFMGRWLGPPIGSLATKSSRTAAIALAARQTSSRQGNPGNRGTAAPKGQEETERLVLDQHRYRADRVSAAALRGKTEQEGQRDRKDDRKRPTPPRLRWAARPAAVDVE